MRLTNYTTYALRTLMFAALHNDRLCQAQEVADAFGISKSHLVKCVHQLGQWGYLQCVRGRNGGFCLARSADEIFVGSVVRKTEDTLELVECFNSDTNSCPLISQCKLTRSLQKAITSFMAELDALSIAEITTNKSDLLNLLAMPSTARA